MLYIQKSFQLNIFLWFFSVFISPWLPVRTAVFLFSFYTFSAIVVGSICFSSLFYFAQFIVSSSMADGILFFFWFNSQSPYRFLSFFMYKSMKIIFIVYLITLLSDTNQNTHLEAEKISIRLQIVVYRWSFYLCIRHVQKYSESISIWAGIISNDENFKLKHCVTISFVCICFDLLTD